MPVFPDMILRPQRQRLNDEILEILLLLKINMQFAKENNSTGANERNA
jgi:hypothetical protein